MLTILKMGDVIAWQDSAGEPQTPGNEGLTLDTPNTYTRGYVASPFTNTNEKRLAKWGDATQMSMGILNFVCIGRAVEQDDVPILLSKCDGLRICKHQAAGLVLCINLRS